MQLISLLNLLMKLSYDLSVQDLPPIFEDNLEAITNLLHTYLTYDNTILQSSDDAEAGPLELLKSSIFELLTLYVQKYDEDFAPYVERFVGSSWNLLTTVGLETKYDILVSKALQFLTAVTRSQRHAQTFNNEATTSQVVERVIIPNLTLRDSDIELFEDEPIEFIRRDLEGADSESRRRSATDFLRQLMAQFEQLVAKIVFRYIEHFLSEYRRDQSAKWKLKNVAVYLFSSIAVKGTVTTSQGALSTNEFVNVIDFFEKNVAQDLLSAAGIEPMLRMEAIKYLYLFRSQISRDQWQAAFPILVKHLASPEYVVYTYSAMCLERVLALRNANNEAVINQSAVQDQSGQLLELLFRLIEEDTSPTKLQENEFLMRCVMRVLIVVRESSLPMLDQVLPHLIKITQLISQNPSNPRFYYYHFEAIGALIRWFLRMLAPCAVANQDRYSAPSQPQRFESDLYNAFAGILVNDVQGKFVAYAH